MTNTLTAEQQLAELLNYTAMGDEEVALYESIRKALTSPPPPPVSGLEWDENSLLYRGEHIGNLTYWTSDQIPNNWNYQFLENMGPSYTLTASEAKSELERRARAWLSPLTNEPVGVTLPADLARCLLVENNQHEKHLLQWTEGRATNKLDEYINLLKQSRDRLSAAIGERG